MKRRLHIPAVALGLAVLHLGVCASESVPVLLNVAPSNGAVRAGLTWSADGESVYEPQTTTNLVAGPWESAGDPVSPSNMVGETQVTTADPARFFRVQTLDTQGPAITYRYPATNGIGVGLSAALVVRLEDATGVDTNAFALTINGSTSLDGTSPGAIAATNGFQYTPPTNTWGSYAETATVEFVCADLLGNTTTSSWSFALELEPILTNTLVHLQPPSGGAKAKLRAAMAEYGTRRGVPFSDHLSIVSMDTNQVVLAYTGGSHGLYVGAVLINHDPAHFFYRRITSLVDDPPNSQVTVQTVHVQLTDIVQQGSFTPEVFSAPAARGVTSLWEKEFGYTIPFSHEGELTVSPIDITEHVRIVPGRFWIDMEGALSVSFTVADWDLKALDTTFSSELSAALRSSVEFRQAVSLIDWSSTIGSPITLITIPIGAVGPIPVWVEVRLVPGWGVSLEAAGSVTFETGIDAYAKTDIRIAWTPEGWTSSKDVIADINPVPLDIGFQLSAEAFVYLRPRLDAVLCPVPLVVPDGLAGIYADYQRGPALETVYEIGDSQCELTLYDKQSVDMGLTVVGFDEEDLPNLTLFEDKEPILTWYWPEIPEQSPVFTRHPSNVTAGVGETITLTASASGSPQPTYQWYQNHVGIPFQTGPHLSMQAASRCAGEYYVSAVNRLGRATSQTATVNVTTGTDPTGMVLIPAGSYSMGDSFSEGSSDERPVHSVYVSAFYMDRYEVTNDEMVDVLNWAHGQGKLTVSSSTVRNAEGNSQELLDLDDSDCRIEWNGSRFVMKPAKGSGYPCVEVTWYGAVAYCNYRTQKEGGGRTPCYSLSDWSCNWSATGYRLPTEAEWEKAARGGLSGQRFPWGATIQHSRANYHSSSSYSYDTSATRGYHPDYNDGGYPYTSPVDTFAANGYGLHDMAGNVWEWCWDWYSSSYYGSSPGSDPRGPSSGSGRVFRGGSWDLIADYCRVAIRLYHRPPAISYHRLGFRAVLPPGQQ